MLSRVLETEAMDTVEEAVEYDRMDHAMVNGRFVDDFLLAHGPCRGGEILDIGTGTARIPIVFCRIDPRAKLLGIDLSEPMLAIGRKNIDEEGLSDRIRLALLDAKNVTLISGGFEGVICNTIVHHIPRPIDVLSEMIRLVAPGGTLFVRDLCRPDDDASVRHLVETHAGMEEPAAKALFEASLRAALTLDEIREVVKQLELPGDDVTMTSDRHWTWIWIRPT